MIKTRPNILNWLLLVCFLALCAQKSEAQVNYRDLGQKTLYFGIALSANSGDFRATPSARTPDLDSVYTVDPETGPGFGLSIISNLQFHNYLDLRFIPGFVFSDKKLAYTGIGDVTQTKTVSSIYVDLPLILRFKSKPIKDIRFYVLGGVRYTLDLASKQNDNVTSGDIVIGKNDFSFEYGAGIQIFFPYFIMSPEIKLSHGFKDVHIPYETNIHSRYLDKLFSRILTISIHLEG